MELQDFVKPAYNLGKSKSNLAVVKIYPQLWL